MSSPKLTGLGKVYPRMEAIIPVGTQQIDVIPIAKTK